MIELLVSPCGAARRDAALDFLDEFPAGTEVLVLGATREAADDLIRTLAARSRARGQSIYSKRDCPLHAIFGLHRFTLTQLAARLAAPELAARGLAPCTGLAAQAVAARSTADALARDRIAYFRPVARCPGFPRTLARTLDELRGAGVRPAELAGLAAAGGEIGALLEGYEHHLDQAHLADRAALLDAAARAAASFAGMSMVLCDVPVETRAERDLLAALIAAAPRVRATVPAGDERTVAALSDLAPVRHLTATAGTATADAATAENPTSSLARLRTYLFAAAEPPAGQMDDEVRFFSAPGENRETVEIARAVLEEAAAGTPFDEMAVFLRSPETYSGHLQAAFRRAGIPAYFARGTKRPDPSGRALLALLACAAEGLSARRFAEYLSFGQIPPLDADGAPPFGRARWSPAEDDAFGAAAAERVEAEEDQDGDPGAAVAGTLAAPWKWEALLVDAAVIGGRERWQRRLDGLEREWRLRLAELADDDPASAHARGIERDLASLADLRRFALPVIDRLAALPEQANWGEWLPQLADLAAAVLRRPERVLRLLAELAPMAEVGPVGIDEVRDVLAERLAFLEDDPPAHRYGRVFVAPADQARGRAFAVVFVPGLAERIFPQRPREDPLLLDALRRTVSADLPTQEDRGRRERLLLQLAVGAAVRRAYLSYPRVDVVQARPRVPSFYGLDVARATQGGIPDFEEFERQAELCAGAHLAWPAPPDPQRAIDAAEHDLATLWRLLHETDAAHARGGARYLLELNAHLARSLRTRFKRWQRGAWSRFDGLVRADGDVAAALSAHRLAARPYSASALERFAACPYRFFLSAIQRLEPRRAVAPLERLDPLTRGRLFHRIQAETLRALRRDGRLPVTAANVAGAEEVLAQTLDAVAAQWHDELAPPIARVWQDEIAALRADLITWLRHLAAQSATWHPRYFELGFGLPADGAHDPESRPDPVPLPGGAALRGSVDLVERRADGAAWRVTDHKTGADRTTAHLVVGGGEVLQPVLYGLAVEAAFGQPVVESRLFFCTARGGFTERRVALDDRARAQAREVLAIIDRAIAAGMLAPAPRAGACATCDFRLVCGPYEEERVQRKDPTPLADLVALRGRP